MWHTVRYLRANQIVYRLYYRLGYPLILKRAMAPLGLIELRDWKQPWKAPLVGEPAEVAPGVFHLLGEVGTVYSPSDWNSPHYSKLWLYNLHYLDDLNANGADERADWNDALIKRWTAENPPMIGNGWEPYPLSRRLVNLVKWYGRRGSVPDHLLQSLARQAEALLAQIEWHILGNHLFANAKALIFVGAFFSGRAGDRWLRQGLKILDREISEQFLADGGHFERSPMYHAILLWDLCDLINLADRVGLSELVKRRDTWCMVLARGVSWLKAMCHPDGEIAFFNDAAIGVAPDPQMLIDYARSLGCVLPETKNCDFSVVNLKESGYVVVESGRGHKAILDVAEIGPHYQPGHAHADTLSFELSLYGQRVIVNSGTSVYGEGSERQRQRSTAAHNTVEINGQNSSEVWRGFRVARRAHPIGLNIRKTPNEIRVYCAHDGYHWLPGSPQHSRLWRCGTNWLQIVDRIAGTFQKAVSRFYLHPSVEIIPNDVLRLRSGHTLRWKVEGGQVEIVESTWHPRFGSSIPNRCINIQFVNPEVIFELRWE